MKKHFVSIIVPAYNAAHTICDTVASLINQEYADWEAVIVDDGSTDTTREVVNKLISNNQKCVIKYYYQDNAGPGAARNHGLKKALGQYIAFLDADDLLLPKSLSRRVGLLGSNHDVDLVFSDYLNRSAHGLSDPVLASKNMVYKIRDAIVKNESNIYFLDKSFYWRCLALSHHPIWTGSVMFRRQPNLYFREDIKFAEDHDYWWRLAKQSVTIFINEPLCVYQTNQSMLTRTYSTELYASTVKAYFHLVSNENFKIKSSLSKRLSYLCFEAGYGYRKEKKYRLSFKMLLKSLWWNIFNVQAWKSLIVVVFEIVANARALLRVSDTRI